VCLLWDHSWEEGIALLLICRVLKGRLRLLQTQAASGKPIAVLPPVSVAVAGRDHGASPAWGVLLSCVIVSLFSPHLPACLWCSDCQHPGLCWGLMVGVWAAWCTGSLILVIGMAYSAPCCEQCSYQHEIYLLYKEENSKSDLMVRR